MVIQQQEIGVDLPLGDTLIYSDNQTLGNDNDLSASSRTKKMLRQRTKMEE
jgi:hypothetical protein